MIQRKIKINAPLTTVFQVIRDFKSYPEFLSTTESAKEKKLKEGIRVEFKVNVIKLIQYTLAFDIEEPNSLSWSLVEGDLMKKNSGAWKLKSLSESTTEALYSIDVEFGWMVPKIIVDQLTKIQLPELLEAFKLRAEKKAKKDKA
jgi:coenzyme Q-binding protein COQ10